VAKLSFELVVSHRPPTNPRVLWRNLTGHANWARRSRFRKNLLAWFAEFQRDLPWRRTRDPYHIWLSEIMLQQTRVAARHSLLRTFPRTISQRRSACTRATGRKCSGYGQGSAITRGRGNLRKAAQEIVANAQRCLPKQARGSTGAAGHPAAYTAAAILSIAYRKNTLCWTETLLA